MAETTAKPTIRILHHLARTGGTVISKCLAVMDGVALLSEIHPRGGRYFNPLAQAHEWFGLLGDDDIRRVNGQPVDFVQAIALIHRRASERGLAVVLRDWTHLDFTAVPFLPQRSYRLTTAEVLSDQFHVVRTATVRHPVDQWLSLRGLAVMQGKISLEEFLHDYRRFAEAAREIGFTRYEDFTSDPDDQLGKLCARLDIAFDAGYRERWKTYPNITGDTTPGRPGRDIAPATRRALEPGLIKRFANNADYRAALDLLGYGHPR